MKKYKIIISKTAEIDINSIINYVSIDLKNIKAAIKLYDKIKDSIFSLVETPQRYALLHDNYLKNQGYRKMLVDNYIIFYYISENDYLVFIVRILYKRRNWNHLLEVYED